MANFNETMLTAFDLVMGQVAVDVSKKLITDKINFEIYSRLSYEQVLERISLILETMIEAIETNKPDPLIKLANQIIETRLRTGYDPNTLLKAINLIAEEFIVAAAATKPDEPYFAQAIRRRLSYIINSSKLHLANLNLTIPIAERNRIDPDLLKDSISQITFRNRR